MGNQVNFFKNFLQGGHLRRAKVQVEKMAWHGVIGSLQSDLEKNNLDNKQSNGIQKKKMFAKPVYK